MTGCPPPLVITHPINAYPLSFGMLLEFKPF
jgi:hypothetical protein